ncbi:MAG: peptidase S41 [Planctomycetaceae bacterium]|nr:peptidase S41 [Planctomycetaceae bacterium]
MPRRNAVLLLVVTLIAYACYVRAEQNPYARYVAAGFSMIDRWALYNEPNQRQFDQQLYAAAMEQMVEVLRARGDEHSMFVPATLKDRYREVLTQEFVGIGIRFRLLGEPAVPVVLGPPEADSPALAAGLRSGDRIVAVDGQATAGLDNDAIAQLIRGPQGSTVTLTVERSDAEEPLEISVERSVIFTASVTGVSRLSDGGWRYRLPGLPGAAFVQITKFGDKTLEELDAILAELAAEPEGLAGLVIDLRGNGGGTLDAGVGISDLFLRAGRPIVTIRGRGGKVEEKFVSTEAGDYAELPLAVLIDQDSASAAEILAACLQDYDRADIVGARSYGKGTVQQVLRLEGGRSLLKLTFATYWRPSGKNIHRMPDDGPDAQWGVSPTPGCEVHLEGDDLTTWLHFRLRQMTIGDAESPELAAALDEAEMAVPADYVDQALVLAVERLAARMSEPDAAPANRP